MWWLAAAAAAPIVANLLMPKPDSPTFQQAPNAVMTPQMQAANGRMLDAAFNPNSSSYQIAADNATNQINTNMSRLGLGRSSMALATNQDTQAKLARDWQDAAFAKQQAAMGVLNQQAGMSNAVNEFNIGQQNRSAEAAYNAAMMQRQNLIGGIGAGANIAAAAYGMHGAGSNGLSSPYQSPDALNSAMTDYQTSYGGMNPYTDYSSGFSGPSGGWQPMSSPGNYYLSSGQ